MVVLLVLLCNTVQHAFPPDCDLSFAVQRAFPPDCDITFCSCASSVLIPVAVKCLVISKLWGCYHVEMEGNEHLSV